MMAKNNLAKRIERLEQTSLVTAEIHYPQSAEEVLALLKTKGESVFFIDGQRYTPSLYIAKIQRTRKPLVAERAYGGER